MSFIDTVKSWFQTGDFPTESQFYQKFSWLRWKDEKIGIPDLADEVIAAINTGGIPVVTLQPGTLQWAAPAGTMLRGFLIKDSAAGQDVTAVRIGTTLGGNEIYEADATFNTANPDAGIIDLSKYISVATIIYFTISATDLNTISINIYKQ
jgi:hypothetical protein